MQAALDLTKPFIVRDGDILAARGSRPDFAPGDRVQVSHRCGDWGDLDASGLHLNCGTVARVAQRPDDKGRFFVYVLMDGMPTHDGKRVPKKTERGVELVQNPPLPKFEAGLVRLIEERAPRAVADFVDEAGEEGALTPAELAKLRHQLKT